jgi:hypothetical protein
MREATRPLLALVAPLTPHAALTARVCGFRV